MNLLSMILNSITRELYSLSNNSVTLSFFHWQIMLLTTSPLVSLVHQKKHKNISLTVKLTGFLSTLINFGHNITSLINTFNLYSTIHSGLLIANTLMLYHSQYRL